LFVYVAAGILCSLSFERMRPLVTVLLVGLLIVAVALFAVPEPEASPALVIMATASIGIAIYVLVAAFIQALASVDRQHAAMVEAQETAQMGSWEFDPLSGNQYWSEGTFALLEMDPDRHEPSVEAFVKKILPKIFPAWIPKATVKKTKGAAITISRAFRSGSPR
jgi:hypothetical protein